jgi:hypothetical protein
MQRQKPGKLEEREQRQNAEQQYGDTFAFETEEPTDTSGIPIEPDAAGSTAEGDDDESDAGLDEVALARLRAGA